MLVMGVPVRHHRYLDRSIATALLHRVPRFRINCASSRITRYHRMRESGPLYADQRLSSRARTMKRAHPLSRIHCISSSLSSKSLGTLKSKLSVW